MTKVSDVAQPLMCSVMLYRVIVYSTYRLQHIIHVLLRSGPQSVAQDLTRVPNAKGRGVVDAVVDLIQESGIFPDDKRLLRRIAYVETKDGTGINYRQNRGIWGVTRDMMLETKVDERLRSKRNEIFTTFNIDWIRVRSPPELNKPLYSALAASLFLSTITEPIPERGDIDGQAEYYRQHYPSVKRRKRQSFKEDINQLITEIECKFI